MFEISRNTDNVIDDVKGVIFKGMVSIILVVVVLCRVMNFFCFLGFLGQKVIPTIAIRVAFTRDLETEGHVIFYVTLLSLLAFILS